MWISLLTLLLLLVTPISCRAEIRQEHGTRFRILLRIWGIPLRFDHSQAPMRPKPPSAQQLQKGKALLRALPKLKRPVRLLMRQTALEQLLVHVSIALRDPAANRNKKRGNDDDERPSSESGPPEKALRPRTGRADKTGRGSPDRKTPGNCRRTVTQHPTPRREEGNVTPR